ncbi:hypothetical protein PHAVU_007G207300 [Phaseolus vulgaris]|uniref:Pentacotripeptide-repeat region of PRORP domain-containing protein n=1 Tax=Phaseolus vulgaris TaxID=3885 RepID=V7BKH2_PHAVU|nr:hypothetical protein PHAVU_007G207300g [Phaseolus vulgaris]ESW17066.1 hypothetical protein PHAVU_007G207300g [Phaseolus vulgaris]
MASLCGRGTITAIRRTLILTSNSNTNANTFNHTFSSLLLPPPSPPISVSNSHALQRHFSSTKNPVDTKLNFSLSDSDSDSDDQNINTQKETGKTNRVVPPPYDPFSKKPATEDPKDPKDLQQIFHDMRSGDGLLNHAVKMFDALSKDGLTHEALELFGQIKDKGQMPDVVAHTAILEAYANAAQPKEALKVYMRMLASGVSPNAYTYAVLITALAADAKFVKDAIKYLLEMIGKGMKPNAKTYTSVFEGLLKEERIDEATCLLEQMKAKGFVPDEKAVREVLNNKRGPVFRNLINVLFGK